MLSSQQFQLFNPGPPVPKPSTADHAKEAMEFASRPDIVWHAGVDPFMRPEGKFHAGTSKSAYERGLTHLDGVGKTVVHPVVMDGDFVLPSSPVEAGLGTSIRKNSPTRWSDSVVNNYPVSSREVEVYGNDAAEEARSNADSHLLNGAVLPYINTAEDIGSTSFVTDGYNAKLFSDGIPARHPFHRGGPNGGRSSSSSTVLTGKFLGRASQYEEEAPDVDLGTVEVQPLPFDTHDARRLNIRTLFHNNVASINRQVMSRAAGFFDTPLGLHPSSPLAQVPAVETVNQRKQRLRRENKEGTPNIFLGLNNVSDPDVEYRLGRSSMPKVDRLRDDS